MDRVKPWFRTIDEHYHASQRTRGALLGFWSGLVFVAAIAALGWLPVPAAPMLVTLAAFGFFGTAANVIYHRYGFDSAMYRFANFCEAESLLVGLAITMVGAPDSAIFLSAFYLVMTVLQAPGSGASPAAIAGAVAPLAVGALYQAGYLGGDSWHITVSTAVLAGFLYWFIGRGREEQVSQAERHRHTERELALASAALENERRLREIERDWIATLTHSASALYLLEATAGLRPVADQAGYRLDELASGTGELRAALEAAGRVALATRQPHALFGVALRGGNRWVDLRIVPLPGGDRLAVLVQDVSDRIALEAKNKELLDRMALADKMVSMGILSAGVAHEINNPLTYISGNIEYMLAQKQLDPALRPPLLDVQKGFQQIERIVGDLKTFSHARSAPKPEPFDLIAVCERTERMIAKEFRHTAALEFTLPPAPVCLNGHADRIQQVLLNLLINARQAMPARPAAQNRIAMRVVADEREARIEIEDNGAGISNENLPRIFDPFYTTKGPGVGTGLGLSVSYQIAREHGGRIDVRSTPGVRTLFTLVLPLGSAPAAQPRVLIIDDEERNLALFSRVLTGFEVLTAPSVAAAVPQLGGVLHAVLCDVRLADGSGFEIYRKAPASLKPKFVFLTALPPDAAELTSRPDGVRVLHKPIPLERLEHELNDVVAQQLDAV